MENNDRTLSNIEDIYPMSDVEKGMIFLSLKEENRPFYNENLIRYKYKNFDINIFKTATELLVGKHEILRTSFSLFQYEKPVQIVYKKVEIDFEHYDISNLNNEQQEEYIKETRKNEKKKFFSIDPGKLLWRMRVFIMDDDTVCILLIIHHAIIDGWSSASLMTELYNIYNRLINEPNFTPEKLKCSYKQYVIEEMLAKRNIEIAKYWKQELNGYNRMNFLTINRDNNEKREIKTFSHCVREGILKELKNIAFKHNTMIKNICFAAFSLTLRMFTYENDIVLGIVNNNRPNCKDGDKILGCFLNTLPIRMEMNEQLTYLEYLKKIDKKMIELSKYGKISLFEIARIIGEKTENKSPIFDVLFNFVNFHVYGFVKDQEKKTTAKNETSGFNNSLLEFSVDTTFEKFNLFVTYDNTVFDTDTIRDMCTYFENILEKIMYEVESSIRKDKIMDFFQRDKVINAFNNTKVPYSDTKTINKLFEEQVEKTPNNIAVRIGDKCISYKELNEKSNQLAILLRNKGVGCNSIVPIMIERSIEMMIGIMGILKTGGAYLPIASTLPEDRIHFMLEDSKANIILTKEKYTYKISKLIKNIILLDEIEEILGDISKDNLDHKNKAGDLCYVIYTSGTTGNPKGVMIEHRSVVNRLSWMQKKYPLHETDIILQKTPYTFDVSVWELFWWSLVGASVYLLEPEMESNPKVILESINNNKISVVHFVPSMFNVFLEYINETGKSLKSLRYIFSSGEALEPKVVMKYNKLMEKMKNTKLINLYGPTEATVDVSYYECPKEENIKVIPIGKPIDNIKLLVVDKNLQLQPIGIIGELCISGVGVGRGYYNKPELTKEKFIENPYIFGERMYRTGDLVRWMPDGNMEFIGRVDNQVKIRGFRIELGEIESELQKHKKVKESIVVVKQDGQGDKYLCAYIISNDEFTSNELRNHLLKKLPEYMIPAYFMKLDMFPLTINGKLDRNALPEPYKNYKLEREYEKPSNEIETKLVHIWSEILDIEEISINDNFFEIGGHSLKAITLVGRIRKEFDVEISLKEIFETATIKELSKLIGKSEKNIYSSIEVLKERDYYETSSAQKRMYMLQQFNLQGIEYNMPNIMLIEGKIDKERLEKAFCKLIKRHEVLRTSFDTIEDNLVQKVHREVDFKIDYLEVKNDEIKDGIKEFLRPFDLSKAPLFRVGLINTDKDKQILIYDIHHIISDGISMSILNNEFIKLYEGQNLEQLKIQYKDYSLWQNKLLKSDNMKKQEEYWIKNFSGEIPILNLQADYVRPLEQSFEGDILTIKLSKNLTNNLKKLVKDTESTMYIVLLSTVNILLSKYSGQQDIIIGSPIAGRSHPDLEKIPGMFVNTLAMRNYPQGNKTYETFLKEVRESALAAYENQDYQFEELVEKLNIERDIGRNPLFDVMFMMDNIDIKEIESKDLVFKPYEQEHIISKFDLTFFASEVEEELTIGIEYYTKLFKRDTIERMLEHLANIIKIINENIYIKLSEIDLITKKEEDMILNVFNDTHSNYPRDKTIKELFEDVVLNISDDIAVVFEDKKLSYKELNERSNQLARTLRRKGIKAESIVGIMTERSLEMIVAMIGILKAGGAFMPIDPEAPEERIVYLLNDSNAKLLLTQNKFVDKVVFEGEIIDLEDNKTYDKRVENLETINIPKDLAYVIYTSGSTGKPKGVLVEHGNVIHLCNWYNNRYDVKSNKNTLQITNIAFDVAILETIVVLLNKGTIYIPNKEIIFNKESFKEFVNKNKINSVQFVPVTLNELIVDNEIMESLSVLISGGDRLENHLKNKVLSMGYKLYNHYGPTETTVDTIIAVCNEKNIIGKPVENSYVYIVNEYGTLQPIGLPGEIWIGGTGVARGYLNRPQLTSEKFIKNPFGGNGVIYKTGDLGRWLSDGNIEFLGRIDQQVKIRGIRIELGEIENQLLKYNSIKEVSVIDRKGKNEEKYLCGYFVADKKLAVRELKEYLSKKLPGYMIPSYLIQLEKMPLAISGKINRNKLPEIDESINSEFDYVAPRNEIEEKLITIWSQVLEIEGFGIEHNFFDLGGHSLKATILTSKIHKEFNIKIPLKEIFKSPTIKGISEYLEKNTQKNIYKIINPVEEKEFYVTSSAQKRMYMLQQLDLQSTSYNMPDIIDIQGNFDIIRLKKAITELMERHEILKTSFEIVDGRLVQKINEDIKFELEIRDSKFDIDAELEDFVKPFDLSIAPIFRVRLVKIHESRYILMFDMHHIISDGVSIEILINEFAKLYEGEKLEKLRVQYKDYAEWQNIQLESEEMKIQEKYWMKTFSGELPVISIPTDYSRPEVKSLEGDCISFKFDKELTNNLKTLAKETNSTMYMVLLSGINVLLSKYSAQEDIIIGTPIAGRPNVDLEKVMGMFINTLAIRNYPEGNKKYIDFLGEVRKNSLKAYENQYYQFEELVEKLNIKRDLSRNPLFDVMFVMQNLDLPVLQLNEIRISTFNYKEKISKFDITFIAYEIEEEIVFNIQYCTKLFREETIIMMMKHLNNIFKTVIKDKEIELNKILLDEDRFNELNKEIKNSIEESTHLIEFNF